jgi:hypothetical protein
MAFTRLLQERGALEGKTVERVIFKLLKAVN